MKTTVVLLRKLHRIGALSAILERDPTKRHDVMTDVIDEVMGYIALEESVFVPAIARVGGSAVPMLRATHVRARLALFRLATQWDGDAFKSEMSSLREIFREHALALSRILGELETALDPVDIDRLDDAMLEHPAAAASSRVDSPGLAHASPTRTASGIIDTRDVRDVA